MRGQSDLIISIIVFSIILSIVLPLAYTIYTKTYGNYPSTIEEGRRIAIELGRLVSEETLNISAIYASSSTNISIVIRNIGGRQVDVSSIMIALTCGNRYYMIIPKEFTPTSIGSGEIVSLSLNIMRYIDCGQYSIRGVYALTREGNIISAKIYNLTEIEVGTQIGEQPASGVKAPQILPIAIGASENTWNISLLLKKGFSIGSIDNINMPTKITFDSNPNQILYTSSMKGRNNYVWVSIYNMSSTDIIISNQGVRNIYLGYDKSPGRYVIVLTGDSTITINNNRYCSGDRGFRVRIYGFRNSTRDGIMRISGAQYSGWIKDVDQNVAKYVFLGGSSSGNIVTLSGNIDRVEIFCRRASSSGEIGYYPYVTLFSNKPSASRLGILFTTIDRYWGFSNSVDEGVRELQDGSTKPFVLVYRGDDVVIDRSISAVSILITYAFHDNSGDDYGNAAYDGVVMIVGIVDENGNVVGYRTFTFRELTRYEDTYPPVAQIQNAVVFIPLPRDISSNRFYPFIAFQDPYSWNPNNYRDDLDITLYIDALSVILYTG